jgi:hypothetical protein
MTGMLGVHLTAVELIKRGFIVSPTSRSAMGADLLITDQRCKKAWSIQVKTNASMANFWLVSPKTKDMHSPSHVYVFVSVPKNPERKPQFYVVPSRVVATKFRSTPPRRNGQRWHAFDRIDRYKDKWALFGNPLGPIPAKRAARTQWPEI